MIQFYGSETAKPKMSKEELKQWMVKQQADDEIPVTGIFENKECPGGKAEFSYKWWPGKRMKITLWDGERYTLPKGIVKWIKKNCAYPDYEYLNQQSGLKGIRAGTGSERGDVPIQENWRVKRMIHRYDFQLTSYVPGFYEELNEPKLFVVEQEVPKQAIISKG